MSKKKAMEDFPGMVKWLATILADWKKTYEKIDKLELSSECAVKIQEKLKLEHAKELAKIDSTKLFGWRKRWYFYLQRQQNEQPASKDDPLTDDPNEEPWITNAEQSTAKAWMPTVNLNAIKEKPALVIGGMLGHTYSTWFGGNTGIDAVLMQMPSNFGECFTLCFEAIRPLMRAMIQRSLALAAEQRVSESRDFFRGFSLAVQKATFHTTGKLVNGTEASLMKSVMLLHADFIKRGIENDSELYEWLVSRLGQKAVWNRKALWKLRDDMGLEFYRGPGRPREF